MKNKLPMRKTLIVLSLLALTGCANSNTPNPVGVGDGIHEYKKSPCACTEIPMILPKA